jgi:outer membrane protein
MNSNHLSRFFIFAIFAGVFDVPLNAQQPDSLTLDRAIEIVMKRNHSIRQAEEALRVAKEHTVGLKSVLYPSINVLASYGRMYPNDPITIPFGKTNLSVKFAPDNNYDAHMGVDYTIFDFGRRATGIAAGAIAETTAADKLQSISTALFYQIVLLFYGLIYESQSIQVLDDGIAALDRHLEIVRKKVDAGTATEYDILKTQTQKETSRSQRIDLASDYAKKQTVLKQLLGEKLDRDLFLKGTFDTTAVILQEDSLVRAALDNRSDRKLAIAVKAAAHAQFESACHENMPALGVRGTAGIKNGMLPDIEKIQPNLTVGLMASVPLYDGKRASSHIVEAKLAEQAAEAGLNDIDERIGSEVVQARIDVAAAHSKIDVSALKVSFAEKALTLAKLKFETGVITNNDVLDAENDFEQAKLGLLQNHYGYVVSRSMLDQTTGAAIAPSAKE